jgi:hypothetical protein
MNEQIQNLLRQTRADKHTAHLMSNPPKMRYSYTLEEQELEKFAKLIVQECIQQIERVGILENIEFESGMIAGSVKEHFGVEK